MVLNGLPTSGVLICSFFYRTMGMLDQLIFTHFIMKMTSLYKSSLVYWASHVPNKWSILFYLIFLLLPYTLLDKFKTKCRCYIILSKKTSVCFFIKCLFEKKKAMNTTHFKWSFKWQLNIIYLLFALVFAALRLFSNCSGASHSRLLLLRARAPGLGFARGMQNPPGSG